MLTHSRNRTRKAPKRGPLASLQPEQAHGVPRVDRSHVLSGKTGRVDVRYSCLDRVRGSKRHVGAEEHVLRAEELQDATDRVRRAEQRRVDVKPAEVFERRPWQSVLDLPIAGTLS